MLQVAVCDDDNTLLRKMKEYIESCPDVECQVSLFSDGQELLKAAEHFSVIFLDIDMPGLNGMDTARRFRKFDKQAKLIFLTSYSEYLGCAFGVHAFSYLLKPARRDVIWKQLKEASDYLEPQQDPVLLEFAASEGILRLDAREIFYFEYWNREILITASGGVYHMKGKITQLSKRLEDLGFSMPHKSFIVNLFHVKSVKGYEIHMVNGDSIPLSQKKSTQFRQELHDYLAKRIGGTP